MQKLHGRERRRVAPDKAADLGLAIDYDAWTKERLVQECQTLRNGLHQVSTEALAVKFLLMNLENSIRPFVSFLSRHSSPLPTILVRLAKRRSTDWPRPWPDSAWLNRSYGTNGPDTSSVDTNVSKYSRRVAIKRPKSSWYPSMEPKKKP